MRQEMVVIERKGLPEGWRWKKLSDFVKDSKEDIVSGPFGSNLVVADYRDEGVPIIRLQNIQRMKFINSDIKYVTPEKAEELKRHSYILGDIVIAKLGDPVGKTCIVPENFEKGIIVADVVRVRVDEKENDVHFMEYILNSNLVAEQLNSKIIGSTRPRVNLYDVRDLILPVPNNKLEQQKIASKLDKQIAQIEMMKKEAEKQLDAVITILESSLGYYLNEKNIFTGTILNFSDICSLDKKQIYPKSNEAMRLTYVGMEDIESNTGKITLNESIKWDSISSNTFYFNQNHVLYGKLRPYLNKVAEPHLEGRCSTELVPILPKSSCKRDYLAMLLRSSQTIQAAMKNKTGSRMPRADMTEIMKLKIKLPDMNEQESILQKMKLFTSQLDEIRSTINIQLNAINQLPTSILNEVFGQYQINS